ncbi:hypothetical protein BU26DRAFT_512459 [Trematosphaeria pertusa]|uniref:Uncharacterized protein n=1 Tax=Trematosphaeria pertusa TaxID=390896 RepID=A0A6A6J0U8_9PLEO|nr:uncharacterized protein BU26DRAFT_512459 [Trematosphaeria pertusa]KAF2255490.1 hypothetical protein BU26DRAFT_512459 [Trematosphaeria pertusa]
MAMCVDRLLPILGTFTNNICIGRENPHVGPAISTKPQNLRRPDSTHHRPGAKRHLKIRPVHEHSPNVVNGFRLNLSSASPMSTVNSM